MNQIVSFILLVCLSRALQYPSVHDQLYVTVGETFRKPLTEFFSTNEKWTFRIDGQQPTEISIFNDDFDQRELASTYSEKIREIISAKPFLIDEYYHSGNQFGILCKTENDKYLFQFNSVASAEPKFDKSIDISQESVGLTCLDFDFYNSDQVIVVCAQIEAAQYETVHFLRINLQTSNIHVKIQYFSPKHFKNNLTKSKMIIQQKTSEDNSKILYLGVLSFNAQTNSYQSPSTIQKYIISDYSIDFENLIDGAFVSQNYNRKAGLFLVDFTVNGDTLFIVDKDPQGDYAYIYQVRDEKLVNKIDPLKIQVQSSTRAYIDSCYVYLHKQEQYTLSKQYYLSIVFSDQSQTLTDSQELLKSSTQLKYEDNGNNIIASITKNYKIIMNLETKTVQVQNLYRNTYEKILQFEGQPLEFIVNQQTDSIIVLYNSYSIQYFIQEPYIQVKPQTPRDLKLYQIVGTYDSLEYFTQVSFPFFYQALQYMDQSIYIKNPQTISQIEAKSKNDKISTTPIMVFGPFVELDYEQNSDVKVIALKSKMSIVTADHPTLTRVDYHIAKRFKESVAILYLLSCAVDIDIAKCTNLEVDFKGYDSQCYGFSQSSEKWDFGIQSISFIKIYRDKQFAFKIKRQYAIESFKMTGELLIISRPDSITFYLYQGQDHPIPIYTIDRQLLLNLGYTKEFFPFQFFINYDISNIIIIQTNNDLIVGRYESSFYLLDVLQISKGSSIFVSITENGFYILEQQETYQSLRTYLLINDRIELLFDNPLNGFKLFNDQAYDPITSIFAISASKDDRYCILIVDPKLNPRDAIYRIIYIEDDIQIKNLQVTSNGDELSITGIVYQQLRQYSTMRSAFFIEGKLMDYSNAFSRYNQLDMTYTSPTSTMKVLTKQLVIQINDFNMINAKQMDYFPKLVDSKGTLIIELPMDLFTGNIASYELNCQQCASGNIYLQAPMFKSNQEDMIGDQKQCVQLYELGLLLCINADNIQIFEDYQVIDECAINGKGVYVYHIEKNVFIATLTDSSLVFLIQDLRIRIQSRPQFLPGYDQQMISLGNNFILTLHQGYDAEYDGYEIFKFFIEKELYVLKSIIVKYVENIQACNYDAQLPAIQYVCGDQFLYYQFVTIDDEQINFSVVLEIDVKQKMDDNKIYLVDPKFIWISNDNDQKHKFFLYDSDGNGYRVRMEQQAHQDVYFNIYNILPTGRHQGLGVNSIQINEQFIVINRQFEDGNYLMIYKQDSPKTAPNYDPTYMIGAQKIKNQMSLLIQEADHLTLAIQVEEGTLSYYNLKESISVVVKDGSAYNNQTLLIKGSNFYESQQTSIYLEKPMIKDSTSSNYLWLYITFPVVLITGIIVIILYQRYSKKQHVGILQQSLQQWQE